MPLFPCLLAGAIAQVSPADIGSEQECYMSCLPQPIGTLAWQAVSNSTPIANGSESLDLPDSFVEESPLFQRWLDRVPDVMAEIRDRPSFVERWQFGYSTDLDGDSDGVSFGVRDFGIGRVGRLSFSGDYQTLDADRWGADVHYFLQPLGDRLNIAPTLGYRDVDLASGLHLGVRLQLVLSRTGAAEVSLSQGIVGIENDDTAARTHLSLGYAIAPQWRLATELEAVWNEDVSTSRWALLLEWIP